MGADDLAWAASKLRGLAEAAKSVYFSPDPGGHPADVAKMHQLMPVCEHILRRFDQDLASTLASGEPAAVIMETAERGYGLLSNYEELEKRLGPSGPQLSAAGLHEDVWGAAARFWQHGNHREAILAAARAVNTLMQDRVDRRDVEYVALVEQAWTLEPPQPGAPRLRVPGVDADEQPDKFKNLHLGPMHLGRGLFMRIRNVLTHQRTDDDDVGEQRGLEYLAALSAFARWVEDAQVVAMGEKTSE